jgi:hypothetical protein
MPSAIVPSPGRRRLRNENGANDEDARKADAGLLSRGARPRRHTDCDSENQQRGNVREGSASKPTLNGGVASLDGVEPPFPGHPFEGADAAVLER